MHSVFKKCSRTSNSFSRSCLIDYVVVTNGPITVSYVCGPTAVNKCLTYAYHGAYKFAGNGEKETNEPRHTFFRSSA
jgi:hypothetical protein